MVLSIVFLVPYTSEAASLQIFPSTGVYSLNSTFVARVLVGTDGKAINAAEGELKFNPQELSVVSVNRSSSVFNLWVTEPTFSNTAGTITFSGGSPSGYTGTSGGVFTITFKVLRAGTTRLSFAGGSVLANDGKGTNVLSGMSGGTYTIEAVAAQPTPEVIEYVAPPNTPATPKITSSTHTDGIWSDKKTAILEWTLPSEITQLRTALDTISTAIPTKVYEDPIRTITLTDLPEGESYFHLQFKNNDGWGKVAHFKLAIDTEKPQSVSISLERTEDLANPVQTLLMKTEGGGSPVNRYMVRVDDQEAFEFVDTTGEGKVTLPSLSPGYHSVIVEAFDVAGNGQIGTFSFTLEAFEQPKFTEYPSEINEEVIPVLRGQTRAGAEVEVKVQKIGAEAVTYKVTAQTDGTFTFIPEGRFAQGVYEITAKAKDVYGAQSLESEPIRIAVQQPGYVQIGSRLISLLSVIVPLFGLTALLVLFAVWLVFYVRRLRGKVSFETKEALSILEREFTKLQSILESEKAKLTSAKKTKKLTQGELQLFAVLDVSVIEMKNRVVKEVKDVESLVKITEQK